MSTSWQHVITACCEAMLLLTRSVLYFSISYSENHKSCSNTKAFGSSAMCKLSHVMIRGTLTCNQLFGSEVFYILHPDDYIFLSPNLSPTAQPNPLVQKSRTASLNGRFCLEPGPQSKRLRKPRHLHVVQVMLSVPTCRNQPILVDSTFTEKRSGSRLAVFSTSWYGIEVVSCDDHIV